MTNHKRFCGLLIGLALLAGVLISPLSAYVRDPVQQADSPSTCVACHTSTVVMQTMAEDKVPNSIAGSGEGPSGALPPMEAWEKVLVHEEFVQSIHNTQTCVGCHAGRGTNPGPVRRLAAFDERFDALWDRASSDYEAILRRDSRHLNWRYCLRPSVEYSVYAIGEAVVRGYVVVRTRSMFGMNLGMIVELLVADRDEGAARVLLGSGVQHLLDSGAEAVACVIPDHPPYGSALRSEGFWRVPEALLPRRFPFMVRLRSNEEPFTNVLDPQRWYLSWGDNDAV